MSGAHKITARCYPITARANITAMLWQLDEAIARNLKELGYGE